MDFWPWKSEPHVYTNRLTVIAWHEARKDDGLPNPRPPKHMHTYKCTEDMLMKCFTVFCLLCLLISGVFTAAEYLAYEHIINYPTDCWCLHTYKWRVQPHEAHKDDGLPNPKHLHTYKCTISWIIQLVVGLLHTYKCTISWIIQLVVGLLHTYKCTIMNYSADCWFHLWWSDETVKCRWSDCPSL